VHSVFGWHVATPWETQPGLLGAQTLLLVMTQVLLLLLLPLLVCVCDRRARM